MKLKIKETAWGIHRMAWGYRERVTAEESFPCEVGDVPDFGKANDILPWMRLQKTVFVFRYIVSTPDTTKPGY